MALFDLDHLSRDLHVAGLRSDGVGLAVHLLGEEVELPPGTLRRSHDRLELLEVTPQPHGLLGDVAAVGKQAYLLDDVGRVQGDVQLRQGPLQPLRQPRAVTLDHQRRAALDLGQTGAAARQLASRSADIVRPSSRRMWSRFARAFSSVSWTSGHSRAGSPWAVASSLTTPGSASRLLKATSSARFHSRVQGQELAAVSVQNVDVDLVIFERSRPVDADVDLDRRPADAVADDRLDLRLQGSVALADAGRELEVTAVDRPHFNRDRPAVALATGLTKAGHAEQQGSIAPIEFHL